MSMIEKINNKFLDKIAKELDLDKEKKEVVGYGLFAITQILFSIVLIILFGLIFDVLLESLIIAFAISILRKSSGGAHSRTPEICAILGTVVSVGLALISKFINKNLILIILIGIAIFLWSFYMVYKLAPVDSVAKPIKNKEKRKKLKKSSMMILSVYLIIVIINILLYYYKGNANILTYILCIYMGLVCQIFSLTYSGHSILKKIDTFFK